MYWIIIILAGVIAGIFSGMFGIGGGLIIVPILKLFTNIPHFTAQGISLAALIGPVSILALINYHKKGHTKIKESVVIALLIFMFSYVGSNISLSIPMHIVSKMFGVLMIVTGFYMIYKN